MAFADNTGMGKYAVMGLIFVVLLVMGMFMNPASIKVVSVPVLFPLAVSVGIDPIWLGAFYILNNEFSTMTPPFGQDFFILKAVVGSSYGEAVAGVLPFILIFCLVALIMCVFPETALWLPSTMK
jgi:TRAP-type C4-dicarboxylate transport system permease large subunit